MTDPTTLRRLLAEATSVAWAGSGNVLHGPDSRVVLELLTGMDGLLDELDRLRARVAELEALLRRIVTYAHEDRARTPGFTRLSRALEEAARVLDDNGGG